MRNLKEIKPLLTALYCINQTTSNDSDIRLLIQYAFNRILNGSANLLALVCAGRTKDEIMPDLEQLLKEETKFIEYKNSKEN